MLTFFAAESCVACRFTIVLDFLAYGKPYGGLLMKDIDCQHYVMKKLWALPWKAISFAELPILLRLVSLMNDQYMASPLLTELAQSAQCSVRTASRATGSLTAKGFILKWREKQGNIYLSNKTTYEVNVNKILELSMD